MNVFRTRQAVADPTRLWALIDGYAAYWALAAAVELGVFDTLADQPADVATLATACGASDPRLNTLLDVLVALGVLDRDGEYYVLTPLSGDFLIAGVGGSMRDLVLRAPGVHENWPVLAQVLKGGRPPVVVDEDPERFYPDLVRSTFPVQYDIARRVATALEFDCLASPLVLDLGTGAAPWAVALLEANRSATAACNDLPGVLDIASESLDAHQCLDRAAFLPGDYFAVDLPQPVDVVVLGHVCRAEGPDRAPELIRRAASALRPGGRMLIADYLVDDNDARESLHALVLGLTMIANTSAGTTFTFAQCRNWLANAGLDDVAVLDASPPTAVLVATKG